MTLKRNARENNHRHQIWCIQNNSCIRPKRNCITEKTFLVMAFLLGAKFCQILREHKNICFFFPVDHCPHFLFARVAAKITFSSLLFLHLWRREKQKIIWYVSSTTNCCYKENIDIIYNGFTGVYRKDITLTILPQVILFVLYHMSFPWFLDLLCCFTILWNK